LLKILGSQYLIGVITRVGGQITAFLLVLVASHHLDLTEFGTYALAWAIIVIANTHVFSGLYHAVLRLDDVRKEADTLFWMIFAVGGIGTAISAGIGYIAGGLGSPVGFALISMSPIPLIFTLTSWNEALLVQAGRIRGATIYVFAAELVGFGVAIYGFSLEFGIFSLILSRLVWAGTGLMITSLLVRRLPRLHFDRDVARSSLRSAFPIWGSVNVTMFSNYGGDLVLAAFLNPAAVGAYRGGARIANTAGDVLLQPLTMMSWSRFARLEASGDQKLIRQAWVENMAVSNALVWPLLGGVTLMAPAIVATLFDAKWGAAAGVVAILSMARAFLSIGNLLEPTMVCLERSKLQLYIRVTGAGLMLAFLLTFGRFSGEAAAYAILFANVAIGVVSLIAMVRILSLTPSDLSRSFLPGTLVALACTAGIFLMEPVRDTLSTAMGLAATVGVVFVIWVSILAFYLIRGILVMPTVR
jgi:O-antigen/teichoic acid export membrane protein